MQTRPAHPLRRLPWSRWLVLALMALCLPLQGVLAVTMQMEMAVASAAAAGTAGVDVQAPHGLPDTAAHAATHSATHAGGDASMSAGEGGTHCEASAQAGLAGHMGMGAHGGDHAAEAGGGHVAHGGPEAQGSHDAHEAHDADAAHVAHSTDSSHAAHQGCGFCDQCCIGAALPVAAVTLAHASPVEDLPVAVPATLPERQPQGLDRPPKHRLA